MKKTKKLWATILSVLMLFSIWTPIVQATPVDSKIKDITVLEVSGSTASEPGQNLFDEDTKETKWCVNSNTGWVAFKLSAPKTITTMIAYHAGQSNNNWDKGNAGNTKAYALQVFAENGIPTAADYANSAKWITICEETNNDQPTKETQVMVPQMSQYYRLQVTDSGDPSSEKAIRFYELELYGQEKPFENPKTITFDANGGSGTMNPFVVEQETLFSLPFCKFTSPADKIFAGWKISGIEGIKQPNDKVIVHADITITAQWEKGSFGSEIPYTEITLLHDDGGYDNADQVFDGDKVYDTSRWYSDHTSFAEGAWFAFSMNKPRSIRKMDVMAGKAGEIAQAYQLEVLKDENAYRRASDKTAYLSDRNNWHVIATVDNSASADPCTTVITDAPYASIYCYRATQGGADIGDWANVSELVLYGVEKVYVHPKNITFDANGGVGQMNKAIVEQGDLFFLPPCEFGSPADSYFKGWQVGDDLTLKQPEEYVVISADTVIKAIWTKEYTLHFEAGKGNGETVTTTIPDRTVATALPACTFTPPKGYIFDCWKVKNGDRKARAGEKVDYVGSNEKELTWVAQYKPKPTSPDAQLLEIQITGAPFITQYDVGDDFSANGMVVTAFYDDDSFHPVENYTIENGTNLQAGASFVTISYTEKGITQTVQQPITVIDLTEYALIGENFTFEDLNSGSKFKTEAGSTIITNFEWRHSTGQDLYLYLAEGSTLKLDGNGIYTYDGLHIMGPGVLEVNTSSDTPILADDDIIICNTHLKCSNTDMSYTPAYIYAIRSMGGNVLLENVTADFQVSYYNSLSIGALNENGTPNKGNIILSNSVITGNRGIRAAQKLSILHNSRLTMGEGITQDAEMVKDWSGFVSTNEGRTTTVYGKTQLTADYTVAYEHYLILHENAVLSVPYGVTLRNDGSLENNGIIDLTLGGKYTGQSPIGTGTILRPQGDIEVSFQANGGSGKMESIKLSTNTFTFPECTFTAPKGYFFSAWQVGNQVYHVGDTLQVTENIVVTAVWMKAYTVQFEAGDGTGTQPSQEVANNESFLLPDCSFIAPPGYVFSKWDVLVDGVSTGLKAAGESIKISSDVVLKATYTLSPDAVDTYYIDENGVRQTIKAIPIQNSSNTLPKNQWYVVKAGTPIEIAETLYLEGGQIHLILEDDASLTVLQKLSMYTEQTDFHIYGQEKGNGTFRLGRCMGQGSHLYIHGGDTRIETRDFVGVQVASYTMTNGKFTVCAPSGMDINKTFTITNGYTHIIADEDVPYDNTPFGIRMLELDSIAIINGGLVEVTNGEALQSFMIESNENLRGNGNGVLKLHSFYLLLEPMETEYPNFHGILMQKSKHRENNYGVAYGAEPNTDFSIIENMWLCVGEGETLTIPKGVTLTIEAGGYLQNSGTIINHGTIINRGTIINYGTLDTSAPAVLNNAGAIYQEGTMLGTCNGTVYERQTISFETGTAEHIEPMHQLNDKTITLPAEISRENYVFAGWFYDGKTYLAGETFTVPKASVTFTALWKYIPKITPKILYAMRGQALSEIAILESFADIPGHFEWMNPMETVSVGTKTYLAKFIPDDLSKNISLENIQISIQVNTYYIVNFSAGEGSGSMQTAIAESGKDFRLPECTLIAPQGKHFARWNVGEAGTHIRVCKNTVIYAEWADKIEILSSGTLPATQNTKQISWRLQSDGYLFVAGDSDMNLDLAPWKKFVTSVSTMLVPEGIKTVESVNLSAYVNLKYLRLPLSATKLSAGLLETGGRDINYLVFQNSNADRFLQKNGKSNAILYLGNLVDDGNVDLADYNALVKQVVGNGEALTEEQRMLADCDGDGAVDAFDIALLRQSMTV